jgi:hypothetical protein
MRNFLFSMALISTAAAVAAETVSLPVRSENVACDLLKRRVATLYDLPVTGPPNLGWWCEFASGWNPELYVIALRSGRKCPEICSNLMGWYAIRKANGEVGEFDLDAGLMKAIPASR